MGYEVVFENDNGMSFCFGKRGSNWYGMDIGAGMSVTLGKSQGFASVGETVETQSIGGRTINVTGRFYGDIPNLKTNFRHVCNPLATGRLKFGDKWYIRVYVKSAPSFSAVKNNGLFKMAFFAPYPFFSAGDEAFYDLRQITKDFHFPINYHASHHFGVRDSSGFINVRNDGDVSAYYRMVVQSSGTVTNPTVTNRVTFSKIKLNGTLTTGEYVTIYRDNMNVLRAEKTSDNVITDVITWIDESSDLFSLDVGDNLLSATDDEGGASLAVSISFSTAVGAIYET